MEFSRALSIYVIASLLSVASAGNILCLMGAASESTQLRSHVLFKALAAKGHKLTILGESKYIIKQHPEPSQSISYVNMDIKGSEKVKDYGNRRPQVFKPFVNMLIWYDSLLPICEEILNSEGYLALLNLSRDKKNTRMFDVIIYDVINAPPCLLSLAQAFMPDSSTTAREVPLVGLNLDAKILPETFEHARGGLVNPAHIPHFMSEFDENMGFSLRIYNLVLFQYSYIIRKWINWRIIDYTNLILETGNAGFLLDYDSIMKRVKVIIVNTHPAFNYIQPLPANVIEIPGWHIRDVEPLTPDLLDLIDKNHDKGVIFISLGSHFRINVAEEQKRSQAILGTIKRMPHYLFLWKVKNGKTIKKPPKNLYINENLPEHNVLGHPRTLIYFTEAESMKLQEAMYNGIPVVAVPLLIDQLNNAKRVFERGLGLRIHFEYFREDTLIGAFQNIMSNYKAFKRNAQRLQIPFRNRPYPPMNITTWWVEQMMKNSENYGHLVSKTYDRINYFVLQSWDVVTLILIFFGLWFWAVYKLGYRATVFLAYGGGRYFTIWLIRLVWHDFLEEEVRQRAYVKQLQKENQQAQKEREERQKRQRKQQEREDRERKRGERGRGYRRRK